MSIQTTPVKYQKFIQELSTYVKGSGGSMVYVSNVDTVSPTDSPQYCLALNKTQLQYSRIFAGDRHHTVLDLNTMVLSLNGVVQAESSLRDLTKELEKVVSDLSYKRAKVFHCASKTRG